MAGPPPPGLDLGPPPTLNYVPPSMMGQRINGKKKFLFNVVWSKYLKFVISTFCILELGLVGGLLTLIGHLNVILHLRTHGIVAGTRP